jgi:hypothetical protein
MIQRGIVKECRCGQRYEVVPDEDGGVYPIQRVQAFYTVRDGILVRLGDLREMRDGGVWIDHRDVCPRGRPASEGEMGWKEQVRRH